MIYHFYQKEWKLKKSITNLHGKTEYVIHIRNLKQALIRGLILKKFHRVIKFSQNEWLKIYIDMNTKLRKQAKNNFEKDFFKLMNNAVFRETMKMWRNYLVSETNYHTTMFFTENLLTIDMKKTQMFLNKPVYLSLSI